MLIVDEFSIYPICQLFMLLGQFSLHTFVTPTSFMTCYWCILSCVTPLFDSQWNLILFNVFHCIPFNKLWDSCHHLDMDVKLWPIINNRQLISLTQFNLFRNNLANYHYACSGLQFPQKCQFLFQLIPENVIFTYSSKVCLNLTPTHVHWRHKCGLIHRP